MAFSQLLWSISRLSITSLGFEHSGVRCAGKRFSIKILVLHNGTRYTVLIYISCQTRVIDGKISCEKGYFLYKTRRKAHFQNHLYKNSLIMLCILYMGTRTTAVRRFSCQMKEAQKSLEYLPPQHSLQSHILYRAAFFTEPLNLH